MITMMMITSILFVFKKSMRFPEFPHLSDFLYKSDMIYRMYAVVVI